MTTVLLAVGDASGDGYAADFVRALRAGRRDVRLRGLGGPALEKQGVEIVAPQKNLAVGGVVELVPHLRTIVGTWRQMIRELRHGKPDLVVLVDSSGFNLPFARRARRAGIPVLYYIAPQVWAWRRGRIRKLARRTDRIAVIFPFEPDVYAGSGARVEFVGHPLVDHVREATAGMDATSVRRSLGVEPGERVVALLPGSRRNELGYCLPVHLEAARVLHARDPRVRFLLPVAPSLDRASVEEHVFRARLPALLRIDVVEGRSLETVLASDVVLAKPGTATLEAALLERPMVVAARGNPISAALLRRMVEVDCLAMPNLIAGRAIVPEFLQQDADPEAIAEAVLGLLAGPKREEQLVALAQVRAQLGEGGAARRAAAIAEEMLVASRAG